MSSEVPTSHAFLYRFFVVRHLRRTALLPTRCAVRFGNDDEAVPVENPHDSGHSSFHLERLGDYIGPFRDGRLVLFGQNENRRGSDRRGAGESRLPVPDLRS